MNMKGIVERLKLKKKDDKEKLPDNDPYIPDELTLKQAGEKETSPLNDPVWKISLLVLLGSFLLGLFQHIIGFTHPIASWFLALLGLGTWGLAVRMLLLDAKLKKFWAGWLLLTIMLALLLSGSESWIAAVGGSFVFLLFRKYRPYRHLTSRRRAALFLLALLVFTVLITGGRSISTSPSDVPPDENIQTQQTVIPEAKSRGRFFSHYASGSLEVFWFFTLLHLFLRARLHFMKLRPKLAVSAFLLAVVPALLIIIMGFIILYGTLGATRGARVRSVLQHWTEIASQDENFILSLFPQSFVYQENRNRDSAPQNSPPWVKEFMASLHAEESLFSLESDINESHYFWIEPELWIIHLEKDEQSRFRIKGGMVNSSMMDRLAQIVQSNVRFAPSITLKVMDKPISTVRPDAKEPPKKIKGTFLPKQPSSKDLSQDRKSLWHRPLGFGLTDIEVIELKEGKLERQIMLLVIDVSIASVAKEITSDKNPFGQAVMISLLAIAIMLLIIESFMFFFGIRITTGFTSAVRALYKGTQRIARGDLDTQIKIPNEDELGDLAHSFNTMTRAVQKGRQEAVLRAHLEGELKTARKIQERLLPHEMPQFPGFEIAGTSIPSKQVGGDYFDFLDLGKGRLGIAIADVSGKGIPAALLMANLQASFHSQSMESQKVGEVATRINNMIVKSTDSNMFVTFFYGLLDRNQSTFTSTNAGHNPPVLLKANKTIQRLEQGGLVLGFLPDQKYKQQTTTLNPGDILVFFTDGITEARTPETKMDEEKLFGEDRLIQVIRDHASLSAREIQAAILQAVSSHTKNKPQDDDITLIVIKRREEKKE
ncbi:MAG: SpoIIE family protein phosphatase [Candidatus Aminicenantes bacterium]|nr:SpoIIE family protein phosphatase [Candidatus Aminicenantes bacterium]